MHVCAPECERINIYLMRDHVDLEVWNSAPFAIFFNYKCCLWLYKIVSWVSLNSVRPLTKLGLGR
ncbi:rCG60648 [Rattus norvegicus]|uniref:RCG60648 n=1 Tax=Rattus norvegicus TaxID=10116 RepID=A6JKX7_RAT|nr:rCG60648 [Rattus norvegicus]